MQHNRRHLPHWIPDESILFVTWRLAGSMPCVDGNSHGPVWLDDPRIAKIVADALLYGEAVRRLYTLHAWAIMVNHVHVVFTPHTKLSAVMHWLKGRTSRLANRILGRQGKPFWQDESYDRWIRSEEELVKCVYYVEQNPVSGGFVETGDQWRWSSASATGHKKRWPVPR